MRRAPVVLALVVLLAAQTATPVLAAQPDQGRSWLALGDSYSSGEGIEGTPASPSSVLGKNCRRATGVDMKQTAWAAGAYALTREKLGLSSQSFVACTGAIADDAPAQIQEAKAAANGRDRWDLVSFSYGGNNIRFSQIIMGCLKPEKKSWRKFEFGCEVTEAQIRRRVDMLAGDIPVEASEYAGSMTLPQLYDQVAKHVNPGGDVVVVGYPNLIEEVDRWGWFTRTKKVCSGVMAKDVPMLRAAAGYLNERISRAVADADRRHEGAGVRFHFLDIAKNPYELDDDNRHGRCSDDPWLNGITVDPHQPGAWKYTDRSFHPHQEGHTNTARVVADHLKANVTLGEPGRAGSVDPVFQGHWRSPEPADQPTTPKVYYVDLTIRDGAAGTVVGEVNYPGLECSGSVTLVRGQPKELVLTERIERQPVSSCLVEGTITLVPSADGSLQLRYLSAGPSPLAMTARLVRA